jgi:hypothetical protein
MSGPFVVRDCALLAIATGDRAHNLQELADRIMTVHPGCLYYHFWGGLLRPRFDDPEFRNDFASWTHHWLHDSVLAERLGIIIPTDFDDLEHLRRELLEVIEERLDEIEFAHLVRSEQPFYFIRSQIVVFDTGIRLEEPRLLREYVPSLSVSSLFYHFVDARRRTPGCVDDFTEWLSPFGEAYTGLIEALAGIDPYLNSLTELRAVLSRVFREHIQGAAQ